MGTGTQVIAKLHKLHVGLSRKAPPGLCSKKGGKLFKVATRLKYFQSRRIFAIRFFYRHSVYRLRGLRQCTINPKKNGAK